MIRFKQLTATGGSTSTWQKYDWVKLECPDFVTTVKNLKLAQNVIILSLGSIPVSGFCRSKIVASLHLNCEIVHAVFLDGES